MTPIELTGARESLHLSQRALAEVLGIHPTIINRWERGHAKIPPYLGFALVGIQQQRANGWPLNTIGPATTVKTTDYTATEADSFIPVDATARPVIVTLPPVAEDSDAKITVKRIDASTNRVTIVPPSSQTIGPR